MTADTLRFLAAGLAIGLGSLGPAIGISILGYGAMQALGRNPEARGPIMTNMILAIAFVEGTSFFGMVIGLLVLLIK